METKIYRYFIELAFNGTIFHGWQIQPGAVTVQETLNHAICVITGQQVNLVGCGRTDAGVHASHFVAHFDVTDPITDCKLLTYRLNRFINQPIRIDRIEPVGLNHHARFQAVSRTYCYVISLSKTPFMKDFSWEYTMPLDVGAMNQACTLLKGKHDFTSFSKLHTDVKTNNCELLEANWQEYPGFLVFTVRSDRFLRNMVRALVGTLVEVGRGKIPPSEVTNILAALDRSRAGISVPAKGLYLVLVEYPPDVFKTEVTVPFQNLFGTI